MSRILSRIDWRPLAVAVCLLALAFGPGPVRAQRGAETAVASSAAAAESDPLVDFTANLEFRNIGPAIMGGRVSDIEAVESNPAIIYVGTATGGVWKTTNHGISWEPIFDDQETSSVGDVTISQTNPNLVWVGSGEPQNRQSSPYGNGVYKSLDGGRTWRHMGLVETRHIARIRIDPRDNDVVYVAAVGHLWGPNEERGVFKTTDGGETWEKVLFVDDNTGAIDVAMDPNDPRTLFAATYQRRRTSFGFAGGGPGSGIWRTLDGGATWERLEEGLPEGEMGRIGLDIYRRDPNLVYAIVEAHGDDIGVYRSTDRGDTWEHLSTTNNRPMYYSQIRVDPNNPERIYLGGSSLYRTNDGGRNFTSDAAQGVHPDHHALWIDPNDSNHLILGGDGGVSVSWDGSDSWYQYDNIILAQFYEIGVDMRDPYYVCGGLQDNGSWCGPSATRSREGIRNKDWYNVGGGDGFYVRIDPNDPTILISESQNGNVQVVDLKTGNRKRIRPAERARPGSPDASEEREYRWNWNTPLLISEHDDSIIYVGSNYLLKSADRGLSWQEVSADLTRAMDRDELEIMGRTVSRGETLSAHDGISSYGNATTISESPFDPGVLYVGTDDGNLQGTRDGGRSWTLLNQDIPGVPDGTYVSRVVASRHNESTVYATFDGHDRDDYRPYAYRSDDYGASWTAIVDGLPQDSVNVIAEHPRDADLLFLGNEVGVYFSVDRGSTWQRLKGNLPTVPVDDIVVHPRDNDLVLGTHGRGVWILDDVSVLEEFGPQVFERPAHLFSAQRAATLFIPESPQGWTPGVLEAPNPPYGAIVRYWLAEDEPLPPAPERPGPEPGLGGGRGGRGGFGGGGRAAFQGGPRGGQEEEPEPTVELVVLDARGNVVRTFEGPGQAGLQQAEWDLRMDPPFERDEGAGGFGGGRGRGGFGGSGPMVQPGTYTVRLQALETTLETQVEVRLDPRVEMSQADLEARQRAIVDANALAKPAYEMNRALQQAREQLVAVQRLVAERDGPEELRDEVRAVQREVGEIGDLLDPVQDGAGAGNSMQSSFGMPTEDELWQVDRAWRELPAAVQAVNAMIGERLPALLTRVYQPAVLPELPDPIEVPARPGR